MFSRRANIVIAVLMLILNGCGGGEAYLLGPQMYNNVEILVEIRPGAPKVGMNEFLVMATHENRLPATNYIVSIKLQSDDEWRQAIQDGATGVYRRAIRVNSPSNDVLMVQIVSKDGKQATAELGFPLISNQ
ncbi:hypothetical protein [Kaarinaea lacus]